MAYLDAASAEPLHPVVPAALQAALVRGWADPARLHAEGRAAARLLDAARESVASAIGAHPDEVSFTGSATQATHLAVLGTLAATRRRRFVTSAVEHSAVLHAGEEHGRTGGETVIVPVDHEARVDLRAFTAALGAGTGLASLQQGNHEVGTLQPVPEVVAACAALEVPLHVDAGQTLGRIPVPTGWSLLSAGATSWGGPPGVGVLAVRRPVRWRAPGPADDREGGRVPGVPDVPAIVAAAAALEAVLTDAATESARLSALVDRLRAEIPRRVPDVALLGPDHDRLPHLVAFSCLYVDGEALVTGLSRRGHAVGSGSSCTASTLTPSHVLVAMGALTHGNVRVSLPRGTTADDVEAFLADLALTVHGLRAQSGALGL